MKTVAQTDEYLSALQDRLCTIGTEVTAYFEAYSGAPLLDSFHRILDLMQATLRAPCDHISIILQEAASVDACSQNAA